MIKPPSPRRPLGQSTFNRAITQPKRLPLHLSITPFLRHSALVLPIQQSTDPLIHQSNPVVIHLHPSITPPLPAAAEPVDGKTLLALLVQLLKCFVVLPKWAAKTLALWILHTYAFHLRDVTTYIGIESPEKRCGKTTLLSLLHELANRAGTGKMF